MSSGDRNPRWISARAVRLTEKKLTFWAASTPALLGVCAFVLLLATTLVTQAIRPAVADPLTSFGLESQPTYSSWAKFCRKGSDAADPQVCFTFKNGRIVGVPAIAVVLIERIGEATKILRVTLPLGMQLQRGTELMVDQSPRLNAPYVVCVTDGCVSDYEATLELISKLKKGHSLLVQGISGSGQVVSFVLPLSDFAQAYDGPPTDAAAFEDR